MEPVTLATVTSAVVNLALEAAKEVAPKVFKETWTQVKKILGWDAEPAPSDLASKVAQQLMTDESLAIKVLEAVKALPAGATSQLVGNIAVSGEQIQVNTGPIRRQTNTFTQRK